MDGSSCLKEEEEEEEEGYRYEMSQLIVRTGIVAGLARAWRNGHCKLLC